MSEAIISEFSESDRRFVEHSRRIARIINSIKGGVGFFDEKTYAIVVDLVEED